MRSITRFVPGKITFLPSKNTHEHGFHEQRRKSTRQSYFTLIYHFTVYINYLFIYPPKSKIVDKIDELLYNKASEITCKNNKIYVKTKEFR